MPHIGRFNLRTEVARQILDTAGKCSAKDMEKAARSLFHKHPLIERCTGGSFNANSLGQLTTIRMML